MKIILENEAVVAMTEDGPLTVEVRASIIEGRTRTVEHELIEQYTSLSIIGYTKNSGGQVVDLLTDGGTLPAVGWTTEKLERLAEIWKNWHLNSLRAACAHQEVDRSKTVTYNLDHVRPCPETGYRFGSSWLVEVLPDAIIKELREMFEPEVATSSDDDDARAAAEDDAEYEERLREEGYYDDEEAGL